VRDPYYCTECHCNHDKHVTKSVYLDIAGYCISAGDWYLMHSDEDYDSIIETAWVQFVMEESLPDHYYINVFHRCGHMTLSVTGIVLEWCQDCRERRSNERYDY